MAEVPNKACPACREQGHDSVGDHLWLMKDGNRWACMKKEYHKDGQSYYEDTKGNAVPSDGAPIGAGGDDLIEFLQPAPVRAAAPRVPQHYVWGPLLGTYRGIPADVYYKYGMEAAYDGTVLVALSHFIRDAKGKELVRKIRRVPKDFVLEGKTGKQPVQLFGQSTFPRAKRILITEGELDALSAYHMLHKYRVACVSLPQGANVKALMDNMEYLKNFKEVYVSTDQDTAGSTVSRDIANLIPTARFLKLSEKDANDMLQEGKEVEFVSAFWDAEIYKPDSIVRVEDILDEILERPKLGEPWPWPTLTEKTYGRNGGQGMYVGAGF